MKMLKRFIVKKNERGLLYSEGDFSPCSNRAPTAASIRTTA